MDPKDQVVEILKEEVAHLRKQNEALTDKVMAFSGEAFQSYNNKDLTSISVPPPAFIDEIGKIQKLEATTEEEQKQKKQAIQEVNELFQS